MVDKTFKGPIGKKETKLDAMIFLGENVIYKNALILSATAIVCLFTVSAILLSIKCGIDTT